MEQAAYSVTSAAYSNSYAGATTTKLFDLSSVTDSLMLQGKDSPNDGQLFDVRTLNIPIESNGGFDILGGANGYAVGVLRATATNTYSTLYRIDLSGTGNVLTSMGDIGRATPAPSTLVQVNDGDAVHTLTSKELLQKNPPEPPSDFDLKPVRAPAFLLPVRLE